MHQRDPRVGPGVEAASSLLAREQRTHVDTARAAFYLCRRPQTMRVWASTECGPIRPIRVNGRLAWPVSEIRQLLGLY
jgi:1,2-phenylacetyl-CoA epoxidase PaaB subunit